MASRGLRCICLTMRDFPAVDPGRPTDFFEDADRVDDGLTCMAIVGIKDPVRCVCVCVCVWGGGQGLASGIKLASEPHGVEWGRMRGHSTHRVQHRVGRCAVAVAVLRCGVLVCCVGRLC
jgi:hypothetical protein